MDSPITIRLGARARQRIAAEGLQPADIAIIPAAAGGPKGLILNGIDTWLSGDWLPRAPRERRLIGASIGAWRMAAMAFADPVAAHKRLAYHYTHQTYPARIDAAYVTRTVRGLLEEVLGGHGDEVLAHPHHRVTVITARGIGPLAATGGVRWREMAGFLRAAAGNAVSRSRLARGMERVLFHDPRDDSAWLRERFDAFASHFVGLDAANLRGALLASGSIPLVLEAVRDIAGAPPGTYWDGGLVDYHLHLPYQRDPGLVLYPHFTDYIVPGWLDKSLPWRRARAQSGELALENVVLVSPSPSFVARLPNRKLPDRNDFKHYGQDHAARIRDWMQAIGESERMAEALARWAEKPDLKVAAAF
ncbi:patatin-like phospholipase family protein [Pseudoduganella sp. SL102]|uniref:patatin-like phospholipase family protein n=1 Tax=Pseudoduganella sp. SL102 TaxID=2995154 RepID=UPI00248B0B44|nr:patatin-like phospholipase family protein [Pseudoduganella sp. SL102]WBS01740.1 patatin-like phospholipase family protein [Pseudoduganella sp. SL102]